MNCRELSIFFYKLQANYQTKKGVKPLILRPYFKYFEQGLSQPANYFETPRESTPTANSSIGVNILGWGGRRVGL